MSDTSTLIIPQIIIKKIRLSDQKNRRLYPQVHVVSILLVALTIWKNEKHGL